MIAREIIENALKGSKESNSFEPLRKMIIGLREKGVDNKDILEDLRMCFCEYNNAGDDDSENLDKANKIADLMDEIDYNRF